MCGRSAQKQDDVVYLPLDQQAACTDNDNSTDDAPKHQKTIEQRTATVSTRPFIPRASGGGRQRTEGSISPTLPCQLRPAHWVAPLSFRALSVSLLVISPSPQLWWTQRSSVERWEVEEFWREACLRWVGGHRHTQRCLEFSAILVECVASHFYS